MSFIELILYCVIGIFAGLLGGLLGIGGGLITVSSLFYTFQWLGFPEEQRMHVIIGTSLGAMIFTSASSAWAHTVQKGVLWHHFRSLAPGIMIGALLGAGTADLLSSKKLEIIFGVSVCLIGIYFLLPSKHQEQETDDCTTYPFLFFISGILIGAISTILGIGGGLLVVPFLTLFRTPLRNAISTSAVLGFLVALVGATTFLSLGFQELTLSGTVGYLYLPALVAIGITSSLFAPFGARLAYTLPVAILRKVFGVVLIIVGSLMITN